MEVVFWNPTTKKFKIIPPSRDIDPNWYVSANNHQVGYDHVKDDYEMLRWTHRSPKIDEDVPLLPDVSFREIYSLSSNSWRKIDDDGKHGAYNIYDDEYVYMDGVSHWWWWDIKETNTWCWNRTYTYNICLSSFDFSSESFITTPIPSYVNDSAKDDLVKRHLMVLNGSIAFMLNHTKTSTFQISILGELGVKESWTKLFIVGPLHCLEYPIGAGKKGNILIRKKDNELAWFDLSTGMIDEIGVTAEIDCTIVFHKESYHPRNI